MNDKDSISTRELRRFADVLSGMGRVYGDLATWLEKQSIDHIPGGGTPTVKRSFGYLGGFAGTVLKAYSKAIVQGKLQANDQLAGRLAAVEAASKDAAQPRAGGDAEEDQGREIDVDAVRAMAKARRRAKRG